MGIEVTETRVLPLDKDGGPFKSRTWKNNVLLGTTYLGPAGSETTGSYRSGARVDGLKEASSSDDALLGATDYKAYFKALHEEYQEDESRKWDNGHGFYTQKWWVERDLPITATNIVGSDLWRWTGHTYVPPSSFVVPNQTSIESPAWPDWAYWGAKMIRETVPTNPTVNFANAVAELRREGLPHAPGISIIGSVAQVGELSYRGLRGALHAIKDLGGDYLNIEFGYRPLAQDVAGLATVVTEFNTILRQYARDSGKNVRRKRRRPIERSRVDYPMKTSGLIIDTPNSNCLPWVGPTGTRHQSVTCSFFESIASQSELWFSGAYTYYSPDKEMAGAINKIMSLESKLHRLIGGVSFDTLWELTPWSWYSDWNYNVGIVLSNLESFSRDNLVLRYGYLMYSSETRHEIVAFPSGAYHGSTIGGMKGPFKTTYCNNRKGRVKASPYGFSQNPNTYTGKQWAILGALGMTKAPGYLPL